MIPQCKRGRTEKPGAATSEKGASLTDWKWQKPRAQQHGSWMNTVCGVVMETPQAHVRACWIVLRLAQGLWEATESESCLCDGITYQEKEKELQEFFF